VLASHYKKLKVKLETYCPLWFWHGGRLDLP
jgi:hypothetical protein